MLFHKSGDIFSSKAKSLVNPVNCVGVAGKGLALEFKRRYPKNFLMYKEYCDEGILLPGALLIFGSDHGKIIINFPTKNHWRDPSRIEWIRSGLENLWEKIGLFEIDSIALPMLGCGLGGLDKNEVKPLIERFAKSLHNVEVELWST